MLGLHNIFVITQQQNNPPAHQQNINQNTKNKNKKLNESRFWGLKKRQEEESRSKDGEEEGSSSNGSSMRLRVCKDCGNRAKKECSFTRCRTCCKTQGFDCSTHVRSTWIPAAKRREKKSDNRSSGSSSGGVKKPRSQDNVHNHQQDATFKKSLPGKVKAPAVFRCIRVTAAINEGEASTSTAEVAYVAEVNISGHVFKGFLYDQGIDEKNMFPCMN